MILDITGHDTNPRAFKCKLHKFSAGETHVTIPEVFLSRLIYTEVVRITCYKWQGDHHTQAILQVVDIIRRYSIARDIRLLIPYLPYSRQDRATTEDASFALKVFAQQINSCQFTRVVTWDAHSDVAGALFDNLEDNKVAGLRHVASEALENNDFEESDLVICSPDAGAYKKIYTQVADAGLFDAEVICANKHRDLRTGEITSTTVPVEDLKGRPVIVSDDICDGGYTFIKLAEALKQANAGDLYLVVTHGIFSKGVEELDKLYTKVYSSNSYNQPEDMREPKKREIPIMPCVTITQDISI